MNPITDLLNAIDGILAQGRGGQIVLLAPLDLQLLRQKADAVRKRLLTEAGAVSYHSAEILASALIDAVRDKREGKR